MAPQIFMQRYKKHFVEQCWKFPVFARWTVVARSPGHTEVDGATDVLQQAGQLCGLQTGEGRLVLGDPLVQVGKLALDGLLCRPLTRLELGVFRIPGGGQLL